MLYHLFTVDMFSFPVKSIQGKVQNKTKSQKPDVYKTDFICVEPPHHPPWRFVLTLFLGFIKNKNWCFSTGNINDCRYK